MTASVSRHLPPSGVVALGVAIVVAASALNPSAQTPVYRASSVNVLVTVSVKRGNRVVANLTAQEFRLTDNGIAQQVDAVSIESVPIDVTLFLDTSGSTSGRLDEMKEDVQGIIKLLRPNDRFRLLTIADAVDEPVPWVSAGTRVPLPFSAVGGISLIHDALAIALLHRTDPDRRHLIVGMTDREDCGSVVSSAQLREMAGRSDAVLHLVQQSGSGGDVTYRTRDCSPTRRADGPAVILEAAERTGGELHEGSFLFRSRSILNAFKRVFDDFRQSYVLRYTPRGVTLPGWHAIDVQVPSVRDATIRARKGYYGDK